MKGGAIEVRRLFWEAVTIGMDGFGWGSVWKGGWFWVKVEGLVFIVEDDESG